MINDTQQELPVQLAPVYYQYAIDRIIYGRERGDTASKALKCIGLYSVIVRMNIDSIEVTHAKLAARIGTTYPGILKPLEYLKRLGLVASIARRRPGATSKVASLLVPRSVVESMRRDIRRRALLTGGDVVREHGLEVPPPWHDTVNYILDNRTEQDTAAKVLKCLGILPFMSRLAANRLPITRPVLAYKLSVAENTIAPLIAFLQQLNMIEVTERRVAGHIGTEYVITLPAAVVERVRREMRRLEKEVENHDWPGSRDYRDIAHQLHQKIAETYSNRGADP